ncbi:MAG: hypothetical protein LBP59_11845 [Planctomycetaceae bacterium]|jgi:2-isopropylmalate synthase|nr:hypothetical protein [Planctomycetaceae bacterium]
MRRLIVFDTTLRDGDQAAGIAFDGCVKRTLAIALAKSGVDIIEAGFPLSSQHDFDSCCDIISALRDFPVKVAVICGANISHINNTAAILNSNSVLHITLPVSDLHIKSFFDIDRKELLKKTRAVISYAAGLAASIEVGAEDATRADIEFLCDYCEVAIEAGAKIVNIADTVGLFVPSQIERLVQVLRNRVDGFSGNKSGLSIHCHNDYGLAVANTLSAIRSGCDQIEVTVGGIGERAGNAALEEVIANISLHPEIYDVSTNIKLRQLGTLVNQFNAAAAIISGRQKPLTGWNVRAHASGIHQKGVEIARINYSSNYAADCSVDSGADCVVDCVAGSVIDFSYNNSGDRFLIHNFVPDRIILSRHSGKAGIRLFAKLLGIEKIDDDKIDQLLKRIKNSKLHFFGITEFLILAKKLRLPEMNLICPISCVDYSEKIKIVTPSISHDANLRSVNRSVKEQFLTSTNCQDKNYKDEQNNETEYEIVIKLSDGTIIDGKGNNPETILLTAVSKIDNIKIKINKTEITSINQNYRIYAELLATNNATKNAITAIERLGTHPNKLLLECLIDVINKEMILTKKSKPFKE